MQDITACLTSLGSPWGVVSLVLGLVTGFVGWIVTSITMARKCRQLRLQCRQLELLNEKTAIETDLLTKEAARRGIAISIPSAEDVDAALRRRAAFNSLKTLGKVSKLTRASEPDPAYEEYALEVRRKVRRFMTGLLVGGAALACSVIAIALWW